MDASKPPEPDDLAAIFRAEFDQEQANLKGLARTMADWFNTLVSEGLEREEALTLTVTLIQEQVRGATLSNTAGALLKMFGIDTDGE